MTKLQAEVVLAYAESNMNIRMSSKKLFMHEASVAYHLSRIQVQMGWNPRRFFDLCYLVGIAAQRLGGNEHENKCNCKPAEGSGLPQVRACD